MRSLATVVGCGLLWGCAGVDGGGEPPPPVSAERIEAERQRLMAPYQQRWAVIGDDVLIETSAKFFRDEVVLWKERQDLHSLTTEQLDGYFEKRWTNDSGGLRNPVQFRIGGTGPGIGGSSFAALETARHRVLLGPFTCRVTVTGNVSVRQGDGPTRNVSSFVIDDGGVDIR